jgi:tetratricopeptide (TPR) repeat protein
MSLKQRALRAQAWVLLALGRRAAALEVFDALLRLQPDDAHAWASRAHLRVQAGEVEAALPDLRRATELAPAQAGHWFNLGYVLAQLERQDEAVAAFREATQRLHLPDRHRGCCMPASAS